MKKRNFEIRDESYSGDAIGTSFRREVYLKRTFIFGVSRSAVEDKISPMYYPKFYWYPNKKINKIDIFDEFFKFYLSLLKNKTSIYPVPEPRGILLAWRIKKPKEERKVRGYRQRNFSLNCLINNKEKILEHHHFMDSFFLFVTTPYALFNIHSLCNSETIEVATKNNLTRELANLISATAKTGVYKLSSEELIEPIEKIYEIKDIFS